MPWTPCYENSVVTLLDILHLSNLLHKREQVNFHYKKQVCTILILAILAGIGPLSWPPLKAYNFFCEF